MLDLVFNVIGGAGVFLILLAYFLLEAERVRSDHLTYLFMNLVGSVLLFISLMWAWNLPSVVIEVCWFLISLYGIVKVVRRRRLKNE